MVHDAVLAMTLWLQSQGQQTEWPVMVDTAGMMSHQQLQQQHQVASTAVLMAKTYHVHISL